MGGRGRITVLITVNSNAVSRVLTEMTRKNILATGILRHEDGLCVTVRRGDLPRLTGIATEYNAEVSVINERGLVGVLRTLRLRAGLILGVIIGLTVVVILSNYLLKIDIKVDNMQFYGKIEQTISQEKIRLGVPLKSVNNTVLERAVLDRLDEAAFVTVSVRGVVLHVNVVSVPKTERPPAEKEVLTATADAIVTRVIVSSGRAKVAAGNSVKAGDVLIDGNININKDPYAKPGEEKLLPVAAEGEVYGKVYHHLRININDTAILTRRTGNKKVLRDMYIGGARLGKSHTPPYANSESIVSKSLISVLVPIKVVTYTYYEIEEYMLEGAAYREMCIAEARAKIFDDLPHGAKVLNEQILPLSQHANIIDFYVEVEQRIDNGGRYIA